MPTKILDVNVLKQHNLDMQKNMVFTFLFNTRIQGWIKTGLTKNIV